MAHSELIAAMKAREDLNELLARRLKIRIHDNDHESQSRFADVNIFC